MVAGDVPIEFSGVEIKTFARDVDERHDLIAAEHRRVEAVASLELGFRELAVRLIGVETGSYLVALVAVDEL